MELIELLKTMELILTQTLTLNPNQFTCYPMVNTLFSTFSALISSNFWSYMEMEISEIHSVFIISPYN